VVVNTFWNLRSFNRDANVTVRHQAVSIADTLKPLIEKEEDVTTLTSLLRQIVSTNEDIISITVFEKDGSGFELFTTTSGEENAKALSDFQLNQLALSFNEPFAGLTYDATLGRNIWNVVVPLNLNDSKTYLLTFQLDTKSVG
jgi:hypothetical protein